MSTAQPTFDDILRLFQETDRQFKETDRRMQETDRRMQETNDRSIRDINRQLQENARLIQRLGAKFGSFTEGLALPAMEKILRDRFGMEVISPSVRVSKAGQHMELDVLAYANGPVNAAYIVEVKSHAREESIAQLKTLLHRFRDFFPEHRDKQLYGILAAVDLSASLREKALQEGLYVAHIHDEVFTLDIPENFQPRAF